MLNFYQKQIDLEYENISPVLRPHEKVKFYSGGTSQSSNQGQQTSSSSGGGASSSTSQAQLTPDQVLQMYSKALPTILNTTTTGVNNSAAAPTLNVATKGATDAVNAINLNGLSPEEGNAIERSTNQQNQSTGNTGNINPTTTVSNAMNFGNALTNKINTLDSAVNTATGVSNAANNATNTVASVFNPVSSNANTAVSKTNSVFGNQAQSQGTNSGGSSSIQMGCFLTTSCCEYKGLPDDCEELRTLRNFRDTYVPPDLVEEYYKIAPNIVIKISGNKEALEYVWCTVKKCVEDIHADRKDIALNRYRTMVNFLKD